VADAHCWEGSASADPLPTMDIVLLDSSMLRGCHTCGCPYSLYPAPSYDSVGQSDRRRLRYRSPLRLKRPDPLFQRLAVAMTGSLRRHAGRVNRRHDGADSVRYSIADDLETER